MDFHEDCLFAPETTIWVPTAIPTPPIAPTMVEDKEKHDEQDYYYDDDNAT